MPNEGLTPAINRKEVEVALKGMKHGKAMGPDGIPVEVWKSLGEEGVDMLLDLLQKIFEQEKMPEEWMDSVFLFLRLIEEFYLYDTLQVVQSVA